MDALRIQGGHRLRGEVTISGSKNAALPIMAAMLLTDEACTLENVPNLRDIHSLIRILNYLGIVVEYHDGTLIRKAGACKRLDAPYKYVSTMRASICLLGPLVGRYGKTQISFPGGCIIGPRPIDLHLKGMRALGANVKVLGGDVRVSAKRLKGDHVYLGGHFGSSVLATANTVMAACRAHGTTILENAACEPEVVDLLVFLNKMGARIEGVGTPTLVIEGVRQLHGTKHRIIPDRIEAGTYILAAAITGGRVRLRHVERAHLGAVIDKLTEAGVSLTSDAKGGLTAEAKRTIRSVDVTTLPYPAFPTDLQAQMMALLCVADGISVITEKIFPDRFIHISELNRMGADIKLEGATAIIKGKCRLSGAPVMASDLRASAGLVLAGLAAKGTTRVNRIYHLDRGYERLEQKFNALGAQIRREKMK